MSDRSQITADELAVIVRRATRRELRRGRLRTYARRFFTSWVADDPDPAYSSLDRANGLGSDTDRNNSRA